MTPRLKIGGWAARWTSSFRTIASGIISMSHIEPATKLVDWDMLSTIPFCSSNNDAMHHIMAVGRRHAGR